MNHIRNSRLSTVLPLALLLACACADVVSAQQFPGLEREFASLFSRIPSLGGIIGTEMPGINNPGAPMILPPIFRGEARVRAYFTGFSGELKNENTGLSLSLVDDLGHVDSSTIVESMLRLKISRLAARVHLDSYLRTFRGGDGRFDWPEWRVGADLDLIDTPQFRFGINMDYNWNQPKFSAKSVEINSVSFFGPKPVTWGLHASLDLGDPRTLRWNVEGRGRLSLRTGSRLDELEGALGILSPETAFGTVLLRGGYRHSWLEFGADPWQVKTQWSGVFVDLSYRY